MFGPTEEWFREEMGKKANKKGRVYMMPLTLRQLMSENYPAPAWVVEELIPAGLTVISAEPASGKTWLLLDIALQVAEGLDLYGQLPTSKTGVLIIDEENGPSLLQSRFKLLGANDQEEVPIYIWSEEHFKVEQKYIDTVIDFCNSHGVRLVMIDTLVRIHGRDENSAVEMAQVFQLLKQLPRNDINVILTHHNRKPSPGRNNPSHAMRGSSDILAAVDCQLSLVKDGASLTLKQNKLRNAEEFKEEIMLLLAKNEGGLEIQYVGRERTRNSKQKELETAILKTVANQHLNQKQLLASLKETGVNIGERTLRTNLERLVVEGKVQWSPGKNKREKIYTTEEGVLDA